MPLKTNIGSASVTAGKNMASRKELLNIGYHDDDNTGMYQVGEIDFGIVETLDKYLEHYGYAGKKDIIDTLGYLIYEVERRFREKNPSPVNPRFHRE